MNTSPSETPKERKQRKANERKKKSRSRKKAREEWEAAGFFCIEPNTLILRKTAELICDIGEELDIGKIGAVLDTVFSLLNSSPIFRKFVRNNSAVSVTCDNHNCLRGVQTLHHHAGKRLLDDIGD